MGDPFTTLTDAHKVSVSGRYYFNTGSGLFQADVDTSEGGAWVLALQYVHQGGTNPALSVIGAGSDLPILSAAALGADESGTSTQWGHAGNAAMSQFTGDLEFRWYAQTSAHSRITHFSTSLGDDYFRTGSGNVNGLNINFTALSGHTSNMPGSTPSEETNHGDYALTEIPFYLNSNYHWSIRADGNRWEVDDYADDPDEDTIHRVWVRSVSTGTAVTNTDDSGDGSFRAAIEYANANSAEDNIVFNISGTGPHTIVPTSELPTITDDGVTIDGTSQPGASCGDLWNGTPHTLQIQVDGGGASSPGFEGLTVNASDVDIIGLSVTRFHDGIVSNSGASDFELQCSYVGLAPDGTTAGNFSAGVALAGSSGRIGGLTAGQGNVLSGNSTGIHTLNGSTDTAIRGNFIGTDPSGLSSRSNTSRAVNHYSGSGSWRDISNNLISGNSSISASNGAIHLDNDTITASNGTIDIVGNYIGVDRTGNTALANGGHGISIPDNSTISNLVIGGVSSADRNIISANTSSGLSLDSQSGIDVLGNYIGLGQDGSSALGNGDYGLHLTGLSDVDIGNGTAAGRNVISSNVTKGLSAHTSATNFSVAGNYFGVSADGESARINGVAASRDTISFSNLSVSNLDILDNLFVGGNDTAIELTNTSGSDLDIQGNRFGLSASNSLLGSIGTHSATSAAIKMNGTFAVTDVQIGGSGGGDGNEFAGINTQAIYVSANAAADISIIGNIMRDTVSGPGIRIDDGSVYLSANAIYDNDEIGIDLGGDDVTTNDGLDGDSGPNDLLNFPVLNTLAADGSTSVDYNLNLDVPSNADGYRIEFFQNSAADSSGYGEGQTYLGYSDVSHSGGNTNFSGSFTANQNVSSGAIISATTTRKTGLSSFDITSEFSANATAISGSIATPPGTGFVTSWNTALGDGDTTIELLVNAGSDDFDVYWGDGTVTNSASGNVSHTYSSGGVYDIEITGDFAGFAFNYGGDGDKVTDIKQWGNIAFEDWSDGFEGADNLTNYTASDAPNLSNVSSIAEMFRHSAFDGDLSNWDTSTIVNMTKVFNFASNFNGDVSTWDTSNVTSFVGLFHGATAFDQNVGNWDVRKVTDMSNAFRSASSFDQDISGWETGAVTNMTQMFDGASAFNQDINTVVAGGNNGGIAWDVSKVESMTAMFLGTDDFNGNISAWDTSLVTNMQSMFASAVRFNADISNWTVTSVTNMQTMFNGATAFSQDISGWDVSGVQNMQGTLTNTASLDLDLSSWDIGLVTNMTSMLNGAGLSSTNYDNTLNGWAAQTVQDGVTLGATGLSYSSVGQVGRDTLTNPPNNWVISDDGLQADPLIVTSTDDTDTLGTLRYAINHANATPGDDAITFNIAGAGSQTIVTTSALPTVTDAGVSIDGTSQTGASCGDLWNGTPHVIQIRIDGGSVSNPGWNGLSVNAANVDIKGLAITRFHDGVVSGASASNFDLQCSYIGLDASGAASGNFSAGVALGGSSGRIGGLSAGQGNVISNNNTGLHTLNGASDTAIRGNFIGTDPTGTSAQSNLFRAINHFTGTASWRDVSKNLISGNGALASDVGAIYLDGDTITASNGSISISGNYIGVDRTGNTALANAADGILIKSDSSIASLVIGGTTSDDRNIISGNGNDGIRLEDQTGVSILGNLIGLGSDGITAIGNGRDGIRIDDATDLSIGNGAASGRNTISANTARGLLLEGSQLTNITLDGNYLGLSEDGETARVNGAGLGNESDTIGIVNTNVSNIDVVGNVIVGGEQVGIELWNLSGSNIDLQSNSIGLTASGATSTASGTYGDGNSAGILIGPSSFSATDIQIGGSGTGNTIVGAYTNGILLSGGSDVDVVLMENTIRDTVGGPGIALTNSSTAALLSNHIYNSAEIAIDLDDDDVTPNDSGDGDGGANDLLNFPVLNTVMAGGTTAVDYDLNLDTQTNSDGYRIEFFKTSSADSSGHGEGEVYLGYIDTGAHAAGDQNYTGSFTASEAVSAGDVISATTTRKTGATSFDVTSEFAANVTAVAAGTATLSASRTVALYDPAGDGLYMTPGNDVIVSLTVSNEGAAAADADSLELIDAIAGEMRFYNSPTAELGNATIGWSESNTDLTFSDGIDVAYSDAGTKPANFAACTYTPISGYDPAVTYVCFNPKGAMAAGDPDPEFTLQYRAQIE